MASISGNNSNEKYVPVGSATEGRAPEFSVDDMLSEEFKQTFNNVDCLSIGEVAGILHEDVKRRKELNDQQSNLVENVIFGQTQKYVSMFSNINTSFTPIATENCELASDITIPTASFNTTFNRTS